MAAVVVDPLSAYLGVTDSHKNAEVRGLLTPLSDIAAKHHTAIVGVTHLNKAVGQMDAMMRLSGSIAFVAAARSAYLVASDRDDKTRRLFLPLKNNLGPESFSGLWPTSPRHSRKEPIFRFRVSCEAASMRSLSKAKRRPWSSSASGRNPTSALSFRT